MRTCVAKRIDYEQSMLRLEEIVTQLESGKLTLEESMKLFEEGVRLSKACYDILQKAEQKITAITDIKNTEEETT